MKSVLVVDDDAGILDAISELLELEEFRKEQTADARLATVPVILMTASPNFREKAKSMDISVTCKKPIDIDSLLLSVQALTE